MFDTKIAVAIDAELAVWQKLNVTAFLCTGIVAAAPEVIGEPYEAADGTLHAAMCIQPILVFAADGDTLRRALRIAVERGLTRAVYARSMFATGHDAANREAFRAEPVDAPDLVGLALRGPRRDVDRATKGLRLHG